MTKKIQPWKKAFDRWASQSMPPAEQASYIRAVDKEAYQAREGFKAGWEACGRVRLKASPNDTPLSPLQDVPPPVSVDRNDLLCAVIAILFIVALVWWGVANGFGA